MTTCLPVHPITGHRAIGLTKRGAPIWPVLGGAPTLVEQRNELIEKANSLVKGRKDAAAPLTDEEKATLQGYVDEVKSLDDKISRIETDKTLMDSLNSLGSPTGGKAPDNGSHAGTETKDKPGGGSGTETPARTLGEHFVKSLGDDIGRLGEKGTDLWTPEFIVPEVKVPGTQQVTGWTEGVPLLTEYDRTIVQAKRERLTIADLCGSGTISGNAISYFVEAAMQGAFTTVAEGAAKPQISFDNPTAKVDALKKIAGWIELTDEFLEDLPFLKSEIDTRALYQLKLFEEAQLLNGPGTGTTVLGIRGRSGVQVQAAPNLAAGNADAVFSGLTKVNTATGLFADGLIIHPTDYEKFRLNKDGNGQYFGGGYFQGQYGNDGMLTNPNLWGMRTVVTTAATLGEVFVGSWRLGATVYRKGGVRVQATNTHADNFTNNKVTIRLEERVALAVRYPAAFVKVALAAWDDVTP